MRVRIFFATGLLYVLVGGPSLGAQICFIAFTVSRVLHAVVYIKALQPWRTMMFAVGLLSLLGMMVLIVRAVPRTRYTASSQLPRDTE